MSSCSHKRNKCPATIENLQKQRHEKLAQIEREHRESEEKRSPSPTVSSHKSIENLPNEGTPELTLPLGKDIEDPSFSLQGMMIIYITEDFFFNFSLKKTSLNGFYESPSSI